MKLAKKLAAVGITAALASPAAMADPILTWDWALFSGWTAWTGDDVTESGGFDIDPVTPGVQQAYDTLSWIDGAGTPSSLQVDNPQISTPGSSVFPSSNLGESFMLEETSPGFFTDTVLGSLLIHDNNVIPGSTAELETAQLTDWFLLESGFGSLPPITSAFDILFEETTNTANPASCSAGQVLGGDPCEDIFVLLNPGDLMFSFSPGDGYMYTLEVTAPALGTLNDDQCAAAGAGPGCVGLVTREDFFNEIQFALTLSARAVPVPSVLALVGLGLLGIGYSRRRNRA